MIRRPSGFGDTSIPFRTPASNPASNPASTPASTSIFISTPVRAEVSKPSARAMESRPKPNS